jgi:hypothetical protein
MLANEMKIMLPYMVIDKRPINRPLHHKTFEYRQENSQLKYLSLRLGELNMVLDLRTFSH